MEEVKEERKNKVIEFYKKNMFIINCILLGMLFFANCFLPYFSFFGHFLLLVLVLFCKIRQGISYIFFVFEPLDSSMN